MDVFSGLETNSQVRFSSRALMSISLASFRRGLAAARLKVLEISVDFNMVENELYLDLENFSRPFTILEEHWTKGFSCCAYSREIFTVDVLG